MKGSAFISFIISVLALYGLTNYYIIRRGWMAFRDWNKIQLIYLILMGLASLAYPVGRIVPARWLGRTRSGLLFMGAFYLGLMFYLFLLILIWDLGRFLVRLTPIRSFRTAEYFQPHSSAFRLIFLVILVLSSLIVGFGYLNSLYPRIRQYEIKIDKIFSDLDPLIIVAVSDLHLGSVVRPSRLKRIVEMINGLKPDLIFLAGDMMDEAISPSQIKTAAEILTGLKARLAIVAVPGNHETYSQKEKAMEEITGGSVRVLADEKMAIGNKIIIIGRRDRAIESMGEKRKKIEDILGQVEGSPLLFLLDHQPWRLDEAEKAGIDLQISGHTHAGQLFPLNFINRRIYEKYWGYYRRGQTHYYISCGVGTWGPPLQTAARPEIVLLIVRGLKELK